MKPHDGTELAASPAPISSAHQFSSGASVKAAIQQSVPSRVLWSHHRSPSTNHRRHAATFSCHIVWYVLEPINPSQTLPNYSNRPVRLFHEPFGEFDADPSAVVTRGSTCSLELVLCCLGLVDKSLKSMFSIPDFVLNSEVEDLLRRIEECGIRGAPEYADRDSHTLPQQRTGLWTVSALRRFLEMHRCPHNCYT